MLHMKGLLFLLLGLAVTGQACSTDSEEGCIVVLPPSFPDGFGRRLKQFDEPSCSTDRDCLSNEVCARPLGSSVDYCMPVFYPGL